MNMQAQVSAAEAPWGQARGMHARLPGEGRTVSDVHWDGRGRAGDRQRDAQDGRIDVGPPPLSCLRLAISSILHFELSSGSDAFLRLSSLQIALWENRGFREALALVPRHISAGALLC